MALDQNIVLDTSRALPSPVPDGTIKTGVPQRGSRYKEPYGLNLVPTKHVLSDEGSYFTVNNAQTGLATAAAQTAFSNTASAFLTLYNGEPAGGKRYYLDYARLICTAPGTAGVSIQAAVALDVGTRTPANGTNLSNNIVSPNLDSATKSSAVVFSGGATALTLAAASTSQRIVCGNVFLKGAIGVAGDTLLLDFGGVDSPSFIGISTILYSINNLPPVVIGPGHIAIFHLWLPSQSAASSYLPELGWWER